MRRVGILGGMGPEATILLQQRPIGAVDGKGDGDHIPLLIDINPRVPSFNMIDLSVGRAATLIAIVRLTRAKALDTLDVFVSAIRSFSFNTENKGTA